MDKSPRLILLISCKRKLGDNQICLIEGRNLKRRGTGNRLEEAGSGSGDQALGQLGKEAGKGERLACGQLE